LKNWTWGERKMRWKLEEIARMEERKGKRVWVGYGKIRIEGQLWRWDEEEEKLKGRKQGRTKRKVGEREGEERKGEEKGVGYRVLECGRIEE